MLLAAGFFSYNVHRLLSYLSIAQPDDRGGHPLGRLKNVITSTPLYAFYSASQDLFGALALALPLRNLPTELLMGGHAEFWWTHALLILAFLNYLPYSKHLHIVSSIPNVYHSNSQGPGPKGVIRFLDREAANVEQFGAADVDQLTWKDLLDGYRCTECGRYTSVCPAHLTGKVLSPRKIIEDVASRLRA